jgi:putative ABC transport system permease protein
MEALTKDIRYALRGLIKRPGFTAIVVLTLALGIGANTAIFSVVNAVLLRPLPYPNPDQLVTIWGRQETRGIVLDRVSTSLQEFVDYRDRNHSFSAIAAYRFAGGDLTGAGDAERILTAKVTAQFFSVLGTQPLRGRSFSIEEDQPGREQVAILSYGMWRRRFGGDDNIVGKNLVLDGVNHTVVGVMPADFQFPSSEVQIWTPMAFDAKELEANGGHYFSLIARTKPGIELHQAQADVAAIVAQTQKDHPEQYEEITSWSVSLTRVRDAMVGHYRLVLLILLGVVSFVWLIACLNVANLLLARAASRQHEIAVRAALGAGRLQIIRQSLAETLLLSLAAGALGLLVGSLGAVLIKVLNPANLPRVDEIQVDHRVLIFTFAISLITGLVFGIIPAMQASRLTLITTLNETVNRIGEGKKRNRLHAWLIIGEVSTAMILLVGAGLLIKSFYRLQQVDLGFNPANVVTMRLSLPMTRYAEPHKVSGFFNELVSRTENLPGVEAVGLVNYLPLKDLGMELNVYVEGQPENPASVELLTSSRNYSTALGLELREGRFFDDGDHDNTTYVAVVNETFTRIFLPNEDALGKRVRIGGLNSPFPWYSIVGVVKDVKQQGPDAASKPELFMPHTQPLLGSMMVQSMSLVLRTDRNPEGSIAGVRAIVRELDPELPVYEVSTMQQLVATSVATRRFNMFIVAIFSALTLVLAAIGVYAVMSYAVTARTREIGIRIALGARAVNVLSLIIKAGMKLAAFGLAIGIGGALALTRLMRTLLFDVTPTDPATFAAVAILLFVVALFACFLPARRASGFDPVDALRHE